MTKPNNDPSPFGATPSRVDDRYLALDRQQYLDALPPRQWQASPRTLPLSVAQRSMWMGEKIGPSDATFNLAEYCEILGPVDPQHFIAAIKQVALEADTWRVQITDSDDGPRQQLAAGSHTPVPFIDLSDQPDPEAVAKAWMMKDITRPLALASAPLWCCALFKAAEDRYFWYHRSHHIILDGFSAGLLSRRVAEIYNASLNGNAPGPNPFARLSRQLALEDEYRSSKRFVRDREYWLQQLANLPEPISLARRSGPRGGGLRRSTLKLDRHQSSRIRQLGDRCGGTLPQTLIALLASYIYRNTGAEDLVFGMPVSARTSKEMRCIPSMMANAVTIRLQMHNALSLAALIPQVAQTVRSALRHQQYRYEELRRDLGLLAKGQQISWVGINIEPFDYDLAIGGHPCISHNLSNGTIEDLTFFVYDRGDNQGLRIDLDANPSLYPQQELDQHRDRLLQMLEAVLQNPDGRLSDIDLLSPAERRQLLYQWNQTEAALSSLRVDQAIAAQAEHCPEALALQCSDQRLSYRQLDDRANQLASLLAQRGVGPGHYVAIALPRDSRLVVSLLAVMKAGAAYVPLDPDQPASRLGLIVEEAKPRLIIRQQQGAGITADGQYPALLWEQIDWSALSPAAVPVAVTTESPAYAIFTSGSTGRPKGVVISHCSLMNFMQGIQQVVAMSAADRVLALTTISFDIATLEIYLPLMVGAQVVLCPRDKARDPAQLFNEIGRHNITLMQATPSHWKALLDDYAEHLGGIKPLVGGEALPLALARQLLKLHPTVTNLYGPTETTVWSTAMVLDAAALAEDHPPAIGRPIRNTQVYVLDSNRQPVPNGVIGELYIGGAGVAKGYLNRPTLTAEKFSDNPFAPGRLYQTGDLGRWREDGTLEYLGRNDFQIKIRGFRIEAEDVESQLQRCSGVKQAVVSVRMDPAGEKRLVAYLLPQGDNHIDSHLLRKTLEENLPDYMIPAVYVTVADLPLNVNGKLDRKALPEPQWLIKSEYFAPRNALEQALETLWAEIFQCERVSIHDSFFDLGGDSLMAAKMISRMRDILGRPVPMAAIFEAATIAELAEQIQRNVCSDPLACLLPLRSEGTLAPLFCVHPVVGLGWGYTGLSRFIDSARPLYALQSRGLDGNPELPGSIEAIAADYVAQIRRLQPHGPYHLLGWSMGGLIAYEMARQLQHAGESLGLLSILDAYPFVQQADNLWQDEASLARSALAFLNLDSRGDAAPPDTMDALCDFLCQEYDILSSPAVRELQSADVDIVQNVRRVIQNNLALARHYRPGPLKADMVFFQALKTARAQVGDLLHHRPEIWGQTLTGNLLTIAVDCDHQQMLDPVATDVVGPALAEFLDGRSAVRA